MKKLKIGIIGSGFGLNCHLPSFRQNKNKPNDGNIE